MARLWLGPQGGGPLVAGDPGREGVPYQPASVLVVEDDVETQEVTRRLLEKAGIQVMVAENGRVALERLAENQPELILLDLMMPEMDGFQFIDHVRQHEAWHAIPKA